MRSPTWWTGAGEKENPINVLTVGAPKSKEAARKERSFHHYKAKDNCKTFRAESGFNLEEKKK